MPGEEGRLSGSLQASPTIASIPSATSATVRAIGPSTGSVLNGMPRRPRGTRPGEGRSPTTPQNAAGRRTEEPRSEPVASHTSPVATLAAAPPEEPPTVRRRSYGLRVGPCRALMVEALKPNSGELDLATGMPPLPSSTATIGLDSFEITVS